MEHVQEPTDVVAVFRRGAIQPHLFRWSGRTYKVTELHSYYIKRHGAAHIHNWSVSASGNVYILEWNSETLDWQLLGIDTQRAIST